MPSSYRMEAVIVDGVFPPGEALQINAKVQAKIYGALVNSPPRNFNSPVQPLRQILRAFPLKPSFGSYNWSQLKLELRPLQPTRPLPKVRHLMVLTVHAERDLRAEALPERFRYFQHYTALNYTALHYTTLHCTALHYTDLSYLAISSCPLPRVDTRSTRRVFQIFTRTGRQDYGDLLSKEMGEL